MADGYIPAEDQNRLITCQERRSKSINFCQYFHNWWCRKKPETSWRRVDNFPTEFHASISIRVGSNLNYYPDSEYLWMSLTRGKFVAVTSTRLHCFQKDRDVEAQLQLWGFSRWNQASFNEIMATGMESLGLRQLDLLTIRPLAHSDKLTYCWFGSLPVAEDFRNEPHVWRLYNTRRLTVYI